MGRRAVALLSACVLALALAGPGQAACPGLIVVSGSPLAEPIVVGDWEAACELYASFFGGEPAETRLAERPSVRLGLFWNRARWEPYVREDRLGELRPGHADQAGHLYPAFGGEPALVVVPGHGSWPKALNDRGLRILVAHGVPVRLDESEAGGGSWRGIALIAGAVFAFPLVLLALRARRSR